MLTLHVTLCINAMSSFLKLPAVSLKIVYFLWMELHLLHQTYTFLSCILHKHVQAEAVLSILATLLLNVTALQSLYNKPSSAPHQLYSIFVLPTKFSLRFSSMRRSSTDAHNTTVNDERLVYEFTPARVEYDVPSLACFLHFYTPSPASTALLSS